MNSDTLFAKHILGNKHKFNPEEMFKFTYFNGKSGNQTEKKLKKSRKPRK